MGATNVVAKNIKQDVIRIEQGDKYKELSNQLEERKGSVIVFVKTKYNADKMAKNLRRDGFTSEALHGDLRQNKRERVMQNFRKQNFRILIATDIAARGLDVPHIEHVVNYDLPQVAEDFIHRMGRTARAGAEGSALSFVSAQEGRKWHAIEVLLDPEAAANDRGGRNNRNGGKPGRNPNARGGRPFQGKGKGNKKPYHGRNKRRDEEGTSENKGEGKKFYGKKPRFNSDSQNGEKKNFSKPRREGERPHGEGKPFKKRFSDEQSQSSDKRNGKRPENKNGNRDQKQEPRQGQAQNGQAAQGQEPRKHTQGKFVKGKKSFSNRGGNPFQGKGPNAKPNKRGNFKGPKKAAA